MAAQIAFCRADLSARQARRRTQRVADSLHRAQERFDAMAVAPKRTAGDKGRTGGGMMLASFRSVGQLRQQRFAIPSRPVMPRGGSMCAEQLADLRAAQNNPALWPQYYQKWGPSL